MCSPGVMARVRGEITRRRFLGGAAVGALGVAAVGRSGPSAAWQAATPGASPAASPVPAVGFGRVVDLSHVHGPSFPMFPGAQPMRINPLVTIEANGFYKNQLVLDEHTGTHMDAPAHFVPDGATAGDLPPERLVAPLCVVDIAARARRDDDAQLTVDDLLAWEGTHGPLPAGALVAMHSGWAERLEDPVAFLNVDGGGTPHFPGFAPEAAAFLVTEREIVGIGVDTISLDFGAAQVFETHIAALSAGAYGLECLANLTSVPPVGATVVVGGPMHERASGGPTRVLALV